MSRCSLFVLLAATVLGAGIANAAPPTVTSLNLRGLQAGGTTTLTIDGADLSPAPRLLLPFPIASQTVVEGATPQRLVVQVTLDASVPAGVYPLRVATEGGVSAAVLVGVDALPQVAGETTWPSLPVAVTGFLRGAEIQRYAFTGEAGQTLVAEIEAQRLGGSLQPVLTLRDARDVPVAWVQGQVARGGDCQLTATLPAAGAYVLELHDQLFRGADPAHFRLKVAVATPVEFAWPMAVQRGVESRVDLLGPGGPTGSFLSLNAATLAGEALLPLGSLSPTTLRVLVTDGPQTAETTPVDGVAQTIAVPGGVTGRFLAAGEEDRYRMDVTPGQTLRFEVRGQRWGANLDPVLVVGQEGGGDLAASDDRPDTVDPAVDVTVPQGVTGLYVVIRDQLRRGGPNALYHLNVTSLSSADFALSVESDRILPPLGGAAVVRVSAQRQNYGGPIRLQAIGLPPGIVLEGGEIPAGSSDVLVSVRADVAAAGYFQLVGEAADGTTAVRRMALAPDFAAARVQPWLRGDLAIGVGPAAPLTVARAVDEAAAGLPLGASVPVRVTIARQPGVTGPVRLTLRTSQVVPLTTITENNQQRQVPDVARSLRFEPQPVLGEAETEVVASLLVPSDLPIMPYDLAIQADLLSADQQSVVASAVSPVRRITPVQPFQLELTGAPQFSAPAGGAAPTSLAGRVVRAPGFTGPLLVTLSGLTPDVAAPEVFLPADQAEFSLPVAFPRGTPLGALAGAQVLARSLAQPGLQSNAIPLSVEIVDGGPPPALLRVFEDEADLIRLLIEGDSQASLSESDRYSGRAALRVPAVQRFRTRLPGLGVAIKETPGPGEYRYLRFAWKKIGGSTVLLQLGINGSFGPTRDQPGPAYRYEAGAPNPFNAAALSLAGAVPSEWTVVTRDLFADFGEFTLDGLAFTSTDGEAALWDHFYLAHSQEDLTACPPPVAAPQ